MFITDLNTPALVKQTITGFVAQGRMSLMAPAVTDYSVMGSKKYVVKITNENFITWLKEFGFTLEAAAPLTYLISVPR
jgi:hypothetical protein